MTAPQFDDKTRTELEAAAFRRLVEHLRERTDVQNIDMMNLAGFCRNCLSRWYRDREQVDATVLLYLCEILTRYVADAGSDPSPALRTRITTLLTMLSLITDNTAEESHADA